MTTEQRIETGIKVGDRFCEMYSYWLVILNIFPNGKIHTIEGNSQNLNLKEYESLEELKKHMSYSWNSPGYWLNYIDNNTNRLYEFINHFKELRDVKLKSQTISNSDVKALHRQKQIEKLIFNI
jgi:hypothetical protein